ncbi:hypothetical protein RSOL_556340 [Rhizoctonia solani AG-3 Rhs1AP]|uniref:Uncharacterized protein n=1 Tax=Rhizoctonia solani AG-3 Rhs1AP TaxID=1086054 RepID=X8JUX6_9AGAM|nr:hypothetical protein RSOL_556340 [Rhizoctonia solani AG-3 Rhs1AP]
MARDVRSALPLGRSRFICELGRATTSCRGGKVRGSDGVFYGYQKTRAARCDSRRSQGRCARAVQSLIGKAVVFSSAVGFIDPNLGWSAGTHPLAPLYGLFLGYAKSSLRRWLKGVFEKKVRVKPAPATTLTTVGQYAANCGVGSYSGRNSPPAPAESYGAAPALWCSSCSFI